MSKPPLIPSSSRLEGATRVTFIHAPDPVYADNQNYGAQFMPLWAYTLAAHIPDDGCFNYKLFDLRFIPLERVDEADIFLFSGINQDFHRLCEVQNHLKSRYPTSTSIVGGPICWSFEQAGDLGRLDQFDHIFIGDGEGTISNILQAVRSSTELSHIIHATARFPLSDAKPLDVRLLSATLDQYYGAVIEVSRGCPFLCEFCDIRVLPDNNRAHNKHPELVIREIERICDLGAQQILLACDNFIGDPRWAEEVVDELLVWQQNTGHRPSLYTWLTVNLFRHPRLMEKMRRAGFDMLFIGVESFDANSLLETAKLQNSASILVEALQSIQSYGFIVVAGLIFGFDSDGDTCFDQTLEGLRKAGLLSGDPSLLTALPGTPLYRRMKLSKRLRDVRYGLGGYKYQTNIRYLMPREEVISGYQYFVSIYNRGGYQIRRLVNYFALLQQGNFIPLRSGGYGSLVLFLSLLTKNPRALRQFAKRIVMFSANPTRVLFALIGLAITISKWRVRGRFRYFQFWLFAWSNSVLKYQGLGQSDFDIESVDPNFNVRDILPDDYSDTAYEPIPKNKIKAQLTATKRQLEALIATRARSTTAVE